MTHMYPRGYVTRIVRSGTDLDSSQCIINLLHQVPTRPSAECATEAEKLQSYNFDLDDEHPEDMRRQLVISIDPDGCRDVDDALSIRRRPDGGFLVGVHIADVGRFDCIFTDVCIAILVLQ